MSNIEIAMLIVAATAVVIGVALVLFLRRLTTTLDRLDEVLQSGKQSMESLEGEIRAAIQGLVGVEQEAAKVLSGVEERFANLASTLVPAVEQIKETAAAYSSLEKVVEERVAKDIPMVLNDIKDITGDVKEISGELLVRIEQTKELFKAVEESGRTVRSVTKIARSGLTGLAVQVASMAVGMKSSLEYVSENIVKKR